MLVGVLLFATHGSTAGGGPMVFMRGHLSSHQISTARYLGRKAGGEKISLAVVLNLPDPVALSNTLRRLYDPRDVLFHQFLTTEQFTAAFSPSIEDIQNLTQYFYSRGLKVSKVHPNRLVVDIEGTTAEIERAFLAEIHEFMLGDGRVAYSVISDPLLSEDLAPKVQLISGLQNFTQRRPYLRQGKILGPAGFIPRISPYLTPATIKSAYNLTSVYATATGSGETLALFELDGYTASDITTYASTFSITAPTLQNVLVDGYSGAAGANAAEVTLDIELAAAIAPGLAKIMVYEGPNTGPGVIDTYNQIATDNLANEVSTSWGLAETLELASEVNSENTIFQQMAAQGQSIFAAAGDSGAYDDYTQPSVLAVDDPASQPYMTAVGGTTLTLSGASYGSEASWGSGTSGGGGGVSILWPIPAYQSIVGQNSDGESSTKRMVPDVSLDANPNTGYVIIYQGTAVVYGGTSCAAPLWAGFMALVNQRRIDTALTRLGFANSALYQVGQSAQYSAAFHDVSDGTSNLYFKSVTDFDLSTGWGSFNGAGLYANLSAAVLPAMIAVPGAPTSPSVTAP